MGRLANLHRQTHRQTGRQIDKSYILLPKVTFNMQINLPVFIQTMQEHFITTNRFKVRGKKSANEIDCKENSANKRHTDNHSLVVKS